MVRMGKTPKGWTKSLEKQRKKQPEKTRRKSTTAPLVIGRIHPNALYSVYIPLLLETAYESSEEYSASYLSWQEDENATLTEPKPHLFSSQTRLDEYTELLHETSKTFQSKDWKIHANAAKFQRQLDERYGYFLPLIKKYPELEYYIKLLQKRYHLRKGSLFQLRQSGKPPIGKPASVMILLMMYRNKVRWEGTALTALFLLVRLEPWVLVFVICLGLNLMQRRKMRQMKGFSKKMEVVESIKDPRDVLKRPVGIDSKDEKMEEDWDVIVLGSGIDALYSAALLSRVGKKVCVLSPLPDASGNLILSSDDSAKDISNRGVGSAPLVYKHRTDTWSPPNASVPFDISTGQLTNFERLQSLLAPALTTTADIQGGIRFVPIGNADSGFAHSYYALPNITDEYGEEISVVLRPGATALCEELAQAFHDYPTGLGGDDTATSSFIKLCSTIYSTSSNYYLSKLIPKYSPKENAFAEVCVRPTLPFLQRCFTSSNPNLSKFFAAFGAQREFLPPQQLSMGVLTSFVNAASSDSGFYYPVGGMRALGHALANVIQSCGGRVYSNVPLHELAFESVSGNDSSPASSIKCTGVTIKSSGATTSTTLKLSQNDGHIISNLGFVRTFIHLIPESIRTTIGVPQGLPALTERRPVFKLIMAISGNAETLNIPSFDYFRIPSFDETIGEDASNTAAVDETATRTRRDKKSSSSTSHNPKRTKYMTGSSYLHITFPSAKDPKFHDLFGENLTTCVVTIDVDDDFIQFLDTTKPKIYTSNKFANEAVHRLIERIKKDVLEIYPQLENKIECTELYGPISKGLSHNPERFAAKGICSLPSPSYPNLVMGGEDVTVDSFSGSIVSSWMAVNAILGYDFVDYLFLEKNVTQDIGTCLGYGDDEEEMLPVDKNTE